MMCESSFLFFSPASCCAQNVSVRLLLRGLLSTTSHTDISRGEQDPEEVFFCLPWTEKLPWE